MAYVREKPIKMGFRVTNEDAWAWRQRAINRQMEQGELFERAAELYVMIPQDRVEEVRAHILRLKGTPADASGVVRRALIVETEEEREVLQGALELMRGKEKDLKAMLISLTTEVLRARKK